MAQFNYTIQRNSNGSWSVVNTDNGQIVSTSATPAQAISNALSGGGNRFSGPLFSRDPAVASAASDARDSLYRDVRRLGYDDQGNALPPPPPPAESAAQQASSAGTNGLTSSSQQQITADGQIQTKPNPNSGTNAVTPVTSNNGGGDSGTNPPVKTIEQTQAINAGTAGPRSQVNQTPVTAISPGVGANNDNPGNATSAQPVNQEDATGSAPTSAASTTNASPLIGSIDTTGENIIISPQANVLDRFSSYTYRASWYLMTGEQYKQLVVSKKKNVNGYLLLMQSGGAPPNSGGPKGALNTGAQTFYENNGAASTNTSIPTANDADAGRNPFFPQDFYFDSITLENLILPNATRAAHSIADIKFTVIEPANISLLDRLYEAVQDFMPFAGQKQQINYAAVTYLMVIRFYGYDENGNLVTNLGAPDPTGRSDPNAVVEKFIPFKITGCEFTVDGKLVSYKITGKSPGLITAAGTRRGTIPYDMQLTAKSIGELLGGDAKFAESSTSAAEAEAVAAYDRAQAGVANGPPPNANAAPSSQPILTQGLMGALNQFQQQLVKDGIYEYADTYRITFVAGGPGGGGQALEKSRLIPPGDIVDKKNLPTSLPPTLNVQSADSARILADISSRNYPIVAGMQIVQAIDMAIRNSDFIYNQQLKFFNENDDEKTSTRPGKEVVWYNITFVAVPKQNQYDRKRNDFAYDISFVINTYVPMNFSSNFFPLNRFRGLHKQYNYWFTGKNTAVLEYKENLNNLYNLTISGNATDLNLARRQNFSSSMRDQPFYSFQSASTESRQGVSGRENEPGSNLAGNLYDPVGLANCRMKIVGDPAWIQQGNFGLAADPKTFEFSAFLSDGSINFDARQIMFEVAWQRPSDYDINTGLADPYSGSSQRQPIQSRVYTATKVVSNFEKGSFTQDIEGLLYYFVKPNAQNKATAAPVPNLSRREDLGPTAGNTAAERASGTGTRSYNLPSNVSAPGSTTPSSFNSAPPGPNDNASPAAPPQPASSNGDIAPVTLTPAEIRLRQNTADFANTSGFSQTTRDAFARLGITVPARNSTTNPPEIVARDP